MTLQAPFPWFGGKSRVGPLVWQRFGDVRSYVEPFFGSGAALFARPQPFDGTETVNDLDGYVSNFWRAVRARPDEVAYHADWPVNENDLHARHAWLVAQRDSLRERLEGDPDFCDVKIAGWWVWGISCWIGSCFCTGTGPWVVEDGRLVDRRQLPHLGNAGQGVNRQLPHLGTAGSGVNRKRPHLGNAGQGESLMAYFEALAQRLARVRVCSGDWSRVCGPSVLFPNADTCAVFLDPPYGTTAMRHPTLYTTDSLTVAATVREWAITAGRDKRLRIALCGYEGEHEMPPEWECVVWKTAGGYEGQTKERERSGNTMRERIWFSPVCLKSRQGSLFQGEK